MPRKRREGRTTYPRYRQKMFYLALRGAVTPTTEKLALDYADALVEARLEGYAPFKDAWRIAADILRRRNVPSKLWGLFKAFVNQYVHQVIQRRVMTPEDVIEYWADTLPRDVMEEIVDELGRKATVEEQVPATKGGGTSA